MTDKKIVYAFTCGGTGGHVYPAIALAQAVQADPTDQSEVFFIGSTNRQDAQIIPKYGFSYFGLGLSSRSIWPLIKAFFKARSILKKQGSQALIGAGGGYTAAVVCAAFSLRIPIFLLEQNVIPGRTNRYLQYLAKRIYLTFPESASFFSARKARCVGNPVRRFFLEDPLFKALEKEILPVLPVILIFGGSQGAQALNQLIVDNYDYFLTRSYVAIHVTGEAYYQKHFQDRPYTVLKNEQNLIKVVVLPYFEKMDWLYKKAALVICRAGATTMSELIHFKKHAVLIPFPYAKDNHQVANAQSFKDQGFGTYYEEKDLTFEKLIPHFHQGVSIHHSVLPAQADASQTIIKDIYGILRPSH